MSLTSKSQNSLYEVGNLFPTSYFISDLAAGVIEQLAVRAVVFADRTAAVDDNIDSIDYPLCPLDRAVGYRLKRVDRDQLGRERRRDRAVDVIFI